MVAGSPLWEFLPAGCGRFHAELFVFGLAFPLLDRRAYDTSFSPVKF